MMSRSATALVLMVTLSCCASTPERPAPTEATPAPGKVQGQLDAAIDIGGGVGKITKIGKQPIALRLHFYANVVRPDNGPEALL
jgi:hypothetical protein